jgi:arsenite methyltransferase
MTDEQLQVARKHVQDYTELLGYSRPNMQFVKGYIENLAEAGIQDESVDMIISNCVVNLSPDKASVIREVYRALAKGGEFYFSDMYCDRRLPKAVKQNEVCTLPVACLQLLIGYLC